jgi:hypothetical protein
MCQQPIVLSVNLYTRSHKWVATVPIQAMVPPPESICWGARFFMRDAAGHYREGTIWMADMNMADAINAASPEPR